MRVRVCDDFEAMAEDWVAAIKAVVPAEFDVSRMQDAKAQVSNLLSRKLAVERIEDPAAIATEFDDIDILVIDYDLLHLDETGSRTTGEGVARLARCLSTCGAIVVMNQFRGPLFDLGMRGHLESYADINIDAQLVGQRALWAELAPEAGQFDPTIWTPLPALLSAIRHVKARLAEAKLEAAILPAVGLGQRSIAELSDTAFGFLSQKAQTADDLVGLTANEFLTHAMDVATTAQLLKTVPEILFNFIAFRIVKWLDRAVLRPMDVLIDAPHLVDRLPFLVDSSKIDPTDPANWAKSASFPAEFLRWDLLGQYHNEAASAALGRIVFDWHRLADDDAIDKLQDAYLEQSPVRFFLAEDTSRFVAKENIVRYRADFHNFGDRRAIEQLANVTYGPQRRLRFG